MNKERTTEEILNEIKQQERFYRLNPQYSKFKIDKESAKDYANLYCKSFRPEVQEYPNPFPTEYKPINLPNNLKISKNELQQNIIGMMLGQCVGDAVGLSTEFLSKKEAELYYKNEHIMYNHFYIDFHRSRWMDSKFHCADWTDDTDQCLLILDSIVRNNGEVDERDFASRLYYWLGFGFTEIGDISALGVGMHVDTVTSAKGWLDDPIGISKKIWEMGGKRSAPNGSVMRTCVAAVPYFWDEEKVVENARKYGCVTHYDPRCQACVTVIVLILAKLLQGRTDIMKIIEESLEVGRKELEDNNHLNDFDKFMNVTSLEELELNQFLGYCFKPVGCTIWCLKQIERLRNEGKTDKEVFEYLIERIVYEAGDADTNACVVGSVLGCYLKPQSIPNEWLDFEQREWLEERMNRLLKLYELEPFTLQSLDTPFDVMRRKFNMYNKYNNQTIIHEFEMNDEKEIDCEFFLEADITEPLTSSCLCQWYPSPFVYEGIEYNCSEKFMMAMKAKLFNDEEIFQQIVSLENPEEMKVLGRKIKNFNGKTWDLYKESIVFEGNLQKFIQNENFKKYLISTGKKILAEAYEEDEIWGIGMNENDPNVRNPTQWKGKNLLGYIFMAIRDYLNDHH